MPGAPRRPRPLVALLLLVTLALVVALSAPGTTAAAVGGRIFTVAGTGAPGDTGDRGSATSARIDHPRGVALTPDGGFLFAEPWGNRVRRVSANGTITTVAGTGAKGFAGDGGPARAAVLNFVHGVAAMPGGGFVLADTLNDRIRRVWPNGTITTVAVVTGDPRGVAATGDGTLLVPDTDNHRVRRVSPNGAITTVAGTGVAGFSGDGGLATAAKLDRPFGVAPVPGGGFLVADNGNQRIRRVWPDGKITTVAGTGVAGFSGDGGPAVAAAIQGPHNVVAAPDGGFVFADTRNHRVRRVWPNGTITTVAGTGVAGFGGDRGASVAAELRAPKAVVLTPEGALLIADAENHRVRFVGSDARPFFRRLAVRVLNSPIRARAGRAFRVRYALTLWARLRLDILRDGRRVARIGSEGRPGTRTLVVSRTLRAGAYRLRLVARSADGQRDAAQARLRIVR